MIAGLGTDVVSVDRVAVLLDRFGLRMARKVLGPDELTEFIRKEDAPGFLARRLAAKEAAVKALGTGFRDGVRWYDVQVGHDVLGRPELHLSGAALKRLQALAVSPRLWISISDERHYAMATVVIEDMAA